MRRNNPPRFRIVGHPLQTSIRAYHDSYHFMQTFHSQKAVAMYFPRSSLAICRRATSARVWLIGGSGGKLSKQFSTLPRLSFIVKYIFEEMHFYQNMLPFLGFSSKRRYTIIQSTVKIVQMFMYF